MTTAVLSPITLDASELERIDRFVNVGLVHIEQLSALCRLLNRAQPDGEAYEQSEADLLTVVEGMLPLLDTVRISFEELRSVLPPMHPEGAAETATESDLLSRNGDGIVGVDERIAREEPVRMS
ncbi:MAG: hypothetical protein NW700_19845 [Nitrospiraceae bacterium]